MATQAQITAVQQLYVSYLGRAADKAGLDFWSNAIANGTSTIESVATGLTLANEYTTKYAGLSNDALVDAVYTNVLGRPADAAGKAFWVSAFANGTVKADTFVSSLIQSLGAQDQATINNKTFVAQTYTDTVGDAYTPEGGAAVLVGVDSTAASVNNALASIAGGTLPGQVPALALITSVDTALTAQVSYETANKAAVDALAANLKLTVADGTSFADELGDVVSAAQAARDAVSATDTTTVLATKASDAAALTAAEYTALGKAGQTKADAYVAAVKADAALTGANAADVTGVKAGLAADAKFDATVISNAAKVDASITSADTLYTFYTAGTTTAAQRTAIDTALKDVPYYSTFKATAVIDSTKNVASQAVTTTKAAVDALDSGKYSADYVAQAAAEKTLADAKAADANVAAAKAQADAYAVKTDATADAVTKLGAFSADGVDLHATTVGAGALTFAATSTDKDVFYFGANTPAPGEYTKAALVGANDGAITGFGSGDSIVLGSGFTFNSGALSTGDNNKTEFFLVQKGSDTLVVLETAAYGSSSTLHTATGDTAAVTSPDAAVITLTGVNVADLTVHNGVISHVA